MEETNIIDFLKSELREARCDFKERVDSQESIKKRHSELSGEIAKTKSKDELNRIIMIVDSLLSIFDAAENQNLFYLGEVPETYLTNTWKDFVKEWRPKFQQLRDRAKFKVENIAPINATRPQPLSTNLSDYQIEQLYQKLVEKKFIPESNKDGFIWAFGGGVDTCTEFKTIWLVDAYFLTDMLRVIKTESIKLAEMKRRAVNYFNNKKGEEISLNGTKNKKDHPTYKILMKILATL